MTHRVRRQAATSALLLVAAALAARPGHAQSGSKATAQALFDQAKALVAAGRVGEACPKFEESQRVDAASGTLVNLAACYEKTGRLASAWSTYQEAAAMAGREGNTERETGARKLAGELVPKLSKLTVDVPPDARIPGLIVTRDGVTVGSPQWGMPIPTDEGEHELRATAPDHEEWRTRVSVTGLGATVSASVPTLATKTSVPVVVTPAPAPLPPAPSAAAPAPAPVLAAARPAPQVEPTTGGLGGQRIAAIAAGGAGVVGLAVWSIFGLQAISKKSDADRSCNGTACKDDTGVSAGNDAHAAGNVATVGLVIGAIGLAGGAALWFTAPSRLGGAQVALGPGSLQVRGAF